jgi:hypothetical protein
VPDDDPRRFPRCAGTTKAGEPCRGWGWGRELCWRHDPERGDPARLGLNSTASIAAYREREGISRAEYERRRLAAIRDHNDAGEGPQKGPTR